MRVGVGVLTFDHIRTGRQEVFERTWESIAKTGYPAELYLLTNGSTDGTEDRVRELGGIVDNGNSQIWYGNTRLIEAMGDVDLCVLSADDLLYPEGWLRRLVSFIEAAPKEIVLTTLQMEPVWIWNTPTARVKCGGEKALIRNSVPGSSWAFRRKDWEDWMGPFPKMMPCEDLEICKKINVEGKLQAALDIVTHIGEENSAWGNESYKNATPLDRKEWGLDAKLDGDTPQPDTADRS